jgi:hypothetical protein
METRMLWNEMDLRLSGFGGSVKSVLDVCRAPNSG